MAVDEGLSPAALGTLAASRAQGSEKGRESPTSLSWGQGTGGRPPACLPSFLPLWTREAAGSWWGRQFTVGTWLWCRLNSLALRRRLAMLLAMLTPGVAGLEPPGL